MAVKYENVVPWGRNYSEYLKMFELSEEDLKKRILGCGDGPASFNSESNKRGAKVISVDPIYIFTKSEIENRVEETYEVVLEQTSRNMEKFIWKEFKSVEELGKVRMDAMKNFLADYEKGRDEGRYIAGELPELSFLEDNSFDIALSSHFLFLYSDNLNFEFHINAIKEMLRVAGEVRIFPIVDNNAELSKHYNGVVDYFEKRGIKIEERVVNYEFQKNGNRMLRLIK